ncbi:hypothetical protein [Methylocucumis oryzae]|uniref:hypothetical protein n=1 Tax=Methylocucumis oryzae TaxID=1632867 RepID=UPI000AD4C42E|nr:hypothetical protein [Methylocucumis oryzae]
MLTLLEPVNYETALLSQPALAEDWLKPEEEEAWAHLQPVKSLYCRFIRYQAPAWECSLGSSSYQNSRS